MDFISRKLDEIEVLPASAAGTEEWVQMRRTGIGGSDVAVVLNMSKWKTVLQLLNEKRFGSDSDVGLPAEIGSFMEPFLRKKFGERDDVKLLERGCGTIRHAKYPFLVANPDDLATGEHGWCVVEYKTTGLYNKKYWKDGSLPPYYWAQVQLYMQVMNSHFPGDFFDHTRVVVLFGNTGIEERIVARDDFWFHNTALPALKSFWSAVESGDSEAFWEQAAASIDGSEATTKAINMAFSDVEKADDVVELDGNVDFVFAQYDAAKQDFESAKEQFESVKNKLKVALKDIQKGQTERYSVSWPLIEAKSRLDTSALRENDPEVYEKYLKPGSSYRGALTVKER